MIFEPMVFVGEDSVTVNFCCPAKHTVFIDVKEDKIWFDGNRLKTTDIKFSYNKGHLFERNRGFEKKRILTCPRDDSEEFYNIKLAVDLGPDGRTFYKFFTRKQYEQFRGAPFRTLSYWHSRREALKKFYDQDLHEPVNVWPVKYKKEVVA